MNKNSFRLIGYAVLVMAYLLLPVCGKDTQKKTEPVLSTETLLKITSQASYNYVLWLPKLYDQDKNRKWPTIVFLHGTSGRGRNLDKIINYGLLSTVPDKKQFPFIMIAPQCPKDKIWASEEWFLPLLEETKKKYRVDEERIYLTGISMGGEGVWYLATKHPHLFAAIAPCSAPTIKLGLPWKAWDIKHLPVWVFHGANDTNVLPEEPGLIVEQLKEYGNSVKFSLFEDLGHNNFTTKVFARDFLFKWFLEKKREPRADSLKIPGKGDFKREEKCIFGGIQGSLLKEFYKDGKRHGKWEYFYPDGSICHISHYKEDKLHGRWQSFYPSGSPRTDVSYKEGREDGEWRFWYKNGVVRRLWHFKEGCPHGKIIARYENGKKQVEGTMKNGKPSGLWQWWDKTGRLTDSKQH